MMDCDNDTASGWPLKDVEKKRRELECVNRLCKDGKELVPVFKMVCRYYDVEYECSKMVCSTCMKKSLNYYQHCEQLMKEEKCVMEFKLPNFENHHVIDSSSKDESELQSNTSASNLSTNKQLFDCFKPLVDGVINKNNSIINNQVKLCNDNISKQVKLAMQNMINIEETVLRFHHKVEDLTKTFSRLNKPNVTNESCVVVNDTAVNVPTNKEHKETRVVVKKSNQRCVQKTVKDCAMTNSCGLIACQAPAKFHKHGTMFYPPVLKRQTVFANIGVLTECWRKCTVNDVVGNGFIEVSWNTINKRMLRLGNIAYIAKNPVKYNVGCRVISKYNNTQDNASIRVDHFQAGVIAEHPSVVNSFRYLIFFDDGHVQYQHHNNIRTIVDKPREVWNEIKSTDSSYVKFLEQYLKKYPERYMVKLNNKHIVTALSGGQWMFANVVEVDASLVRLKFMESGGMEWLYRGSARLRNIHDKLKGVRLKQSGLEYLNKPFVEFTIVEKEPMEEKPIEEEPIEEESIEEEPIEEEPNEEEPIEEKPIEEEPIEEKPIEEEPIEEEPIEEEPIEEEPIEEEPIEEEPIEEEPIEEDIVVEKKLESDSPIDLCSEKNINVFKCSTKNSEKQLTTKETLMENNEVLSKVVKLNLPDNIPKYQKYTAHNCNYSCVAWTLYDYKKTKRMNLLTIPLHFGFCRLVSGFQSKDNDTKNLSATPLTHKEQKYVCYICPCGYITKSIEEMMLYLMATKNKMTIDMFNFESWVEPLNEFEVKQSIVVCNDLSNGKELKPIPCINTISKQLPPSMKYITSRLPMKGVNVNTDPNFLCGCDCTDDCLDKSKCACCQLTIKNQNIFPIDADPYNPNIGYKYRKLFELVFTGIYECNSTCSCSKSCLNRIVQQPLSQKLQLFMTEQKGWGVRCVNDIPSGSFICTYVGYLLNENDANQEGKKYGDEYLADLDYIEVVEETKEGYEKTVQFSHDETSNKMSSGNKKTVSETPDDDYRAPNELANKPVLQRLVQKSKRQVKKKSRKIVLPKHKARIVKPKRPKSVRHYFGKEENMYILDAKTAGNIGRYLNHSCSPNMFVQNVFVDTYDVRFPWISFFSFDFIPAGTELTWDYNYDIGSVPGKKIMCRCGSSKCRKRLL